MKIYIAGHRGLVGQALVRRFGGLTGVRLVLRVRAELDLTSDTAVDRFFDTEKPDIAIVAAGKVGGVGANIAQPTEFLLENLQIAKNTINAAYKNGTRRLLFVASSSIYPRDASQPMREEILLGGPLEGSLEGYAISKIAGLKMCSYYRQQYGVMFHSVVPSNLYGPNDNYDEGRSHVIPALIHRFHLARCAKKRDVAIWGDGGSKRDFLHVDDLARACELLIGLSDPPDWVNAGSGRSLSIRDAAGTIRDVVGFHGSISWDTSKPSGAPEKLLDTTTITRLGWKPSIGFAAGIRETYEDYVRRFG